MSFAKHPEHSEGHLPPGELFMIIEPKPIIAKISRFPTPKAVRRSGG